MKTLLLLVNDDYAETLKAQLPADQAWVLDARYDAFRCQLRHSLETYLDSPASSVAYHDTIKQLDAWLGEQGA